MGKTVKVGRALLSVFDKSGMVDFAKGLSAAGVELVSTGGTHKLIADAGLPVREISDLTGFPEMMDGRVKTLHPKVHGGLLAVRDKADHAASMAEHEIGAIDLVAVNLYPFEKTIASGAGYDEVIENIDIGGPAMVRSAAKNHAFVTVVVDPADYPAILASIAETGGVPYEMRQKLAAKAYARTAAYDSVISGWFARELDYPEIPYRSFAGTLREVMRYGENPHQWAAFYANGDRPAGRFHGAPGAGQDAQLQQYQRYRCGVRTRLRIRSGQGRGRRHHQACQSLRRGGGRRPDHRLSSRPCAPIRCRPLAASSPPIARSMRRRPKRSSRCSPR